MLMTPSQRNGRLLEVALLAICVVALLSFALQAQNSTGSLIGEVQDASGARIKSATITVTDNGQGVARQASTNSQGEFHVPDLQPGSYHIVVSAKGFADASAD